MKNKTVDAMPPVVLAEHDAKKLLKRYGIPVVDEKKTLTPDEAVIAARTFGYPVVLKAHGNAFLHKTEHGLVKLNLADARAVRRAAIRIGKSAGSALEGFLVQPQVDGRREFLAGIFRDPQFGPVIVFGLGGIFTEALSDTALRLAPIGRRDAEAMLGEIRASGLLSAFRGEAPADAETLVQVLLALSRLSQDQPDIVEVDINPLRITADGRVRALDALVINSQQPANAVQDRPPVDPHALGLFFHPRTIAFVGASAQIGKWGHILFTITASGGFGGDIHLVNPKGGTIAGRPVYRNVNDIPGSVDLAVVTLPSTKVSDLIPQLAAKRIRHVLLITSGFSETGAAGKAAEQELVHRAAAARILIVGPNTMGICNPHIHLYCTGSHVRPLPGSTAVVAQSGNMGTQLLAFAEQQGIGIRAFCGSGNEAMVTIEDFLDAFETDDLTRTVMLYVESVKNGRRFFESAARLGRKKPIVLLKGGRSRAGSRAAASHTGALSSDARVFDAVCRQSGIIQVDRPMDLLDLSAAFSSLPLPQGSRAAILTLGGGWGVVAADLCSEYHLDVPALSAELIETFDRILPPYWSRSNPVDIVGEMDNAIPLAIIEALLKWDGCDAVINLGIMGRRILLDRLVDSVQQADPSYTKEFLESARQSFEAFEQDYIRHIVRLMATYQKPVYGVSMLTDQKDQTVYRVPDKRYQAVFYASPERAVKAFAKMVEYNRFKQAQR